MDLNQEKGGGIQKERKVGMVGENETNTLGVGEVAIRDTLDYAHWGKE